MTGLLPSQAQRMEFKCVSAHWHTEHCLCTVVHMFFSFAAFQLLDVCQF